jgi:DNA mismatch repair protein MutS2
MIYPQNFEQKIGFTEIRSLLNERCQSSLGREQVSEMYFSDNADEITEWLSQIRDLRKMKEEREDLPLQYFYDMRDSIARMRLEGTHMEEEELFNLKKSLDTIDALIKIVRNDNIEEDSEAEEPLTPKEALGYGKTYPALYRMADGVATFPEIVRLIDRTLDKFGKVKDSASPTLQRIRRELAQTEGSISRILGGILRSAQSEGLVEKDAAPALRDGRLVIPVAPGLKKKIRGIVHDESASGRTVYIEPAEVVEANNKVRELENDERREVIRILKEIAAEIRPWWKEMLDSYTFLAKIDFVNAKVSLAEYLTAIEPQVKTKPMVDMIEARHPLLQLSLQKQNKKVVPLEIKLTSDKRILIISGPNAGGKSVCLKTTGLIQYMLQCGLSIPVSERSTLGIFSDIMIDIGDEQSIENDLSTYSSHLTNMKNMIRQAGPRTLILIDEFGTGTEPGIGGAIAEAVLQKFCEHKAFGVITTHYQNLKHFADSHEGIANGAMLYDRHEMKALFQLQIGRPGSSFAIEIARKIGLPEDVIMAASDIVGQDYIQSDKYLQDIVRDKRYWESKRQAVHQREKDIEKTIAKYETGLTEVEQERKAILRHAKGQAQEIIREANKRIENTIREIREAQAEKEATRKLREEIKAFEAEVSEFDSTANDEAIARKIAQIQARRERKAQKKKDAAVNQRDNKSEKQAVTEIKESKTSTKVFTAGDTVRIKGTKSVGAIDSIDSNGKMAVVIFGDMRTKMRTERLEHTDAPTPSPDTSSANKHANLLNVSLEKTTRETIDSRRSSFRQEIDVRGMRGDEAMNAVQYFIDDAILVGVTQVRILHGKGNGILRQLIRQYLNTVPNVLSARDEHVQFGGAGITVVELE